MLLSLCPVLGGKYFQVCIAWPFAFKGVHEQVVGTRGVALSLEYVQRFQRRVIPGKGDDIKRRVRFSRGYLRSPVDVLILDLDNGTVEKLHQHEVLRLVNYDPPWMVDSILGRDR